MGNQGSVMHWCSAGLTLPPNAERSVWVWEGLHRSDDHTRLLGLLHQNARSGQQQESRCENQLRKVKTPTVSGPGPLQWVDLATHRTRYWNGLYRLEGTCVGSCCFLFWVFRCPSHHRASVDPSRFILVVKPCCVFAALINMFIKHWNNV